MSTEEVDTSNPLIGGNSKKTNVFGHLFRYFGLLFICLMTLGSYYIYDIPAALQSQIESLYHVDHIQWNLLYSVYSFPNMIVVFFGGYFIDNVFGLKKGAIVFCCLVMAGQIIFAVSANTKLFWLALVGRTIFGLGGESLGVAQSTFCASWFKGRSDINLAFAITLAFSRIGSAINFQISPMIYNKTNTSTAVWFGAIICGVSFAACVILVILDVIRGKKDKEEPVAATATSFMDIIRSFRDVLYFPGTLWLVNLSVVLFYVPLFVFVSISSDFFLSKYNITVSVATTLSSIPYYAAVSSPLIGLLVDIVGHNVYFMGIASILLAVAHGLFTFSDVNPWAGSIFLGGSYACMAASIWATIPCLVPSKRLGSAYGLAFACQNAAVASFGLIINAVIQKYNTNPLADGSDSSQYDSPGAYQKAGYIFFGLSCLCVLIQATLIIVDRKNRWINVPSAQMKQRVKDINPEDEKKPLLVNEDDN
ncbi:hypothetical protein DICPUDRAFT_157851 [Dictyostelium purpureum]|uniref:Lysosomal dipeptide transporter MFSD1 n=1 Tax=Dictyostelium purpureum TaxID=5786 RepID=F1A059_DICPU|nr:uncharacterized protein DICPUDRAFT_157851 [Dictyostelium purpureum]EGC30430.1 hypothetical protein DICPUDRAFT_157851 [Dictyostelium purpureum]|eukprot:XP_003293054.1 hypothetical protein DICPUDRAFT_157851 [Dictyostelium purpureum]